MLLNVVVVDPSRYYTIVIAASPSSIEALQVYIKNLIATYKVVTHVISLSGAGPSLQELHL